MPKLFGPWLDLDLMEEDMDPDEVATAALVGLSPSHRHLVRMVHLQASLESQHEGLHHFGVESGWYHALLLQQITGLELAIQRGYTACWN